MSTSKSKNILQDVEKVLESKDGQKILSFLSENFDFLPRALQNELLFFIFSHGIISFLKHLSEDNQRKVAVLEDLVNLAKASEEAK